MKNALILLVSFCLGKSLLAQNLTLKDSVNNTIASYIPGSKIKKQKIIEAKKIYFEYNDGSIPEYNFYLTTGVTEPFIKPGVYGNLLSFDFKLHIGKIVLPKEATMIFDVLKLHTKNGGSRFDKGALFYIIE